MLKERPPDVTQRVYKDLRYEFSDKIVMLKDTKNRAKYDAYLFFKSLSYMSPRQGNIKFNIFRSYTTLQTESNQGAGIVSRGSKRECGGYFFSLFRGLQHMYEFKTIDD